MTNPALAEVLRHLEDARVDLRAAVDSVPRADRERKPAPDRWSVAEVIEHLAIVENRVTARLSEALEQGKASGVVAVGGEGPWLDRDLAARARRPAFYQWAVFLGAHDARHASQIREIAAQFSDRKINQD